MSVIAYQRVIDALEAHGCHGTGRGQWQCPAHDDGTPSLSVTDASDRVLVCCQAGCDTIDVLAEIDLGWGALFDEPAAGKGWSTSTLRKVGARANGDGRLELGGVRYMPGGEPKTLAVKGSKRDLWPDPATVEGRILFVVEGEPDRVSAFQIGLPAVAIPGAGKWDPGWAARLAEGRDRVVVIEDADEKGRKAAQKWAAAIVEHAEVAILPLAPERDDGFDLSDYAADAVTDVDRAELRRCLMGAAESVKPFVPVGGVVVPDPRERSTTPPSSSDPETGRETASQSQKRYDGRVHSPDVMTSLLQLPAEPTAWRVHGLVADGTSTILSAEAGAGKSVLMASLCDGVTAGRVIAGMPCVKGVALYVDGEMGPKMFANRLRKAGVEACAFWYVDAMGLDISVSDPDDLGWIRGHIERAGANLVVIDSLRRLMPSRSENDSDDMAPAVGAVTKLARDTGAAIVLVHHKGDGEKFYRGSSAIKDQTDALFALLPVNPDDDDDLRRRLTCRGTRGKAPRYDVATPDQFMEVDFDNGGVVAVGAPEDVGPQIPARQAVALAIKAALPAKTKTEVADKIGRRADDKTFRDAWNDVKAAGEIVQLAGHWERGVVLLSLGTATTNPSDSSGVTP